MVQFIADHRAVFGVEPICAVLPIAPSTYHRQRHQRTHPTRRSARAQRDDQLRVEIQRVYDEHQQVHGPRKVWKQLRRDGVRVARCTVARLMRAMGLAGAVRGRAWVTTTHAGEGGRPVDLVDRRFVATRPNQLWVSRFHVRRNLGRLCLRRVRHRRVCATHCGLAGVGLHAHGLCAVSSPPWRGLRHRRIRRILEGREQLDRLLHRSVQRRAGPAHRSQTTAHRAVSGVAEGPTPRIRRRRSELPRQQANRVH